MIESIARHREAFLAHLKAHNYPEDPAELYEPIRYIMDLGGKRIRPILVLLSTDLYGSDLQAAMPAAMAVEVFHNFSLVHDDIMDAAPLRRGRDTVHQKWDTNTAILSGDAMLIEAYRQLEAYPPEVFKDLLSIFSRTALEVCEGQRYDMDFETMDQVSIDQYLHMIQYKTAVLLGCSLKMGALVGGASRADQDALYAFGINLGLAFQLQDDYLDVFGDPETFGKQVGGDIIENKKTFLYLKSLELSGEAEAQELRDLYSIKPSNPESKIRRVSDLFESTGAAEAAKARIHQYTQKAFEQLKALKISDAKRTDLRAFGEWLLNRNF